ncbi:unnamed protein product, partial [Staurois parvus]
PLLLLSYTRGALCEPLLAFTLGELFIPLTQDTIPPTDTNDGALFLPLTPTIEHSSCY